MKSLIYGGLTALLLTTATTAMAQSTNRIQAEAALSEPSSMIFNFSAPIITNSGALGSTQFIRIAVIGMTLKDLQIAVPSQMERYDSVRVIDQAGKEVSTKINSSKERVGITFDQPVAPGGYLQVEFVGVRMSTPNDGILQYGVTGKRAGVSGDIPIGTARIQLPNRG
ncbi:DUF2808 domain-containing protein [Stenomitos frigidus]|uniref:DUF2808 domain-containing protein n=1 Tax=Stenomitos frigidus ULC18 TaxID=2107698 RepID=A0A2T1DXK8_9CYAN|nr:DUF2808 domain-containing protein [Stenomitos frigidus]PSB25199.1 hypothetical protein C7B82_24200 [Stenomitos frigidus ULC18]